MLVAIQFFPARFLREPVRQPAVGLDTHQSNVEAVQPFPPSRQGGAKIAPLLGARSAVDLIAIIDPNEEARLPLPAVPGQVAAPVDRMEDTLAAMQLQQPIQCLRRNDLLI